MTEPSNTHHDSRRPGEALDGSAPPAVLAYSIRLLRHVEKMEAANIEVKAATIALREKQSARHKRRAEAALVAHAKAQHRLRRSAMRLREAVEEATRT